VVLAKIRVKSGPVTLPSRSAICSALDFASHEGTCTSLKGADAASIAHEGNMFMGMTGNRDLACTIQTLSFRIP
jgi:hypothetical protein